MQRFSKEWEILAQQINRCLTDVERYTHPLLV